MIALNIILIIIALIVAFFIVFKLLRSAIKALMFILFLALFVIAIFGVLIYMDIGKVKGSFENGQTVLLLHNNHITAGFEYSEDNNKILESDRFKLLDETIINEIDEEFSKGNYNNNETLTIIMKSDFFLNKSIELGDGENITLNSKNINTIFDCTKLSDCEKPLIEAAPSLKEEISRSFDDEQDLKNKLFYNMFSQETKNSKGSFIISGVRDDQIIVYPALTTLKLVKIMPFDALSGTFKKINAKITNNDSVLNTTQED